MADIMNTILKEYAVASKPPINGPNNHPIFEIVKYWPSALPISFNEVYSLTNSPIVKYTATRKNDLNISSIKNCFIVDINIRRLNVIDENIKPHLIRFNFLTLCNNFLTNKVYTISNSEINAAIKPTVALLDTKLFMYTGNTGTSIEVAIEFIM